MMIKIYRDSTSANTDSSVIASPARTGNRWTVGTWPLSLTRNRAITALMLAERLATGYGDDGPRIVAWQEELRVG